MMMSNCQVHPVNLLPSSLLCHPIFGYFSLNNFFPSLFNSNSDILFYLLSLSFPVNLSPFPVSMSLHARCSAVNHCVIMYCSQNCLLFSALKSCYFVRLAHIILFCRRFTPILYSWLFCAAR